MRTIPFTGYDSAATLRDPELFEPALGPDRSAEFIAPSVYEIPSRIDFRCDTNSQVVTIDMSYPNQERGDGRRYVVPGARSVELQLAQYSRKVLQVRLRDASLLRRDSEFLDRALISAEQLVDSLPSDARTTYHLNLRLLRRVFATIPASLWAELDPT